MQGLEIPDVEALTPSHILPVGGMFSGIKVFASLVLLPSSLLHDPESYLDFSNHTNLSQTYGLARQWFGCLVRSKSYEDSWIPESLSGHLVNHYVKSTQGGGSIYMSRIDAINEIIVHCNLVSGRKGRSELSELFSSSTNKDGGTDARGGGSGGDFASTLCRPLHPAQVAVLSVCPNRTDDGGVTGEGIRTGDATRSLRAVMTAHMLEQRVGEKYFRSGIINVVSVVANAEKITQSNLMGTTKFVNLIAQQTVDRDVFEELSGSFAHQWIYDAGCADLIVGYW